MEELVVPISSSGHCPKLLSAELTKVKETQEIPEYLKLSAEEGNLHEDAIKSKLRSEGYEIEENHGTECEICKSRYGTGRQGIHVEIVRNNIRLVGHLDGKISHPTKPISSDIKSILECKSMSVNEFGRWRSGKFGQFPNYAAQLTCYMYASEIDSALYVVKNRNSGFTERLIVVNRLVNINDIWNKLDYVYDCIKNKILAEAEYNPESIECQRCRIKNRCIPEPNMLNPLAKSELIKILQERDIIDESINELKTKKDTAEQNIKDILTGLQQDKVRINTWSLTLKRGMTRTTYPKDNLINAGVTIDQLKTAQNVSAPFDTLYIRNFNKPSE